MSKTLLALKIWWKKSALPSLRHTCVEFFAASRFFLGFGGILFSVFFAFFFLFVDLGLLMFLWKDIPFPQTAIPLPVRDIEMVHSMYVFLAGFLTHHPVLSVALTGGCAVAGLVLAFVAKVRESMVFTVAAVVVGLPGIFWTFLLVLAGGALLLLILMMVYVVIFACWFYRLPSNLLAKRDRLLAENPGEVSAMERAGLEDHLPSGSPDRHQGRL
jgi:hypothetical protein